MNNKIKMSKKKKLYFDVEQPVVKKEKVKKVKIKNEKTVIR